MPRPGLPHAPPLVSRPRRPRSVAVIALCLLGAAVGGGGLLVWQARLRESAQAVRAADRQQRHARDGQLDRSVDLVDSQALPGTSREGWRDLDDPRRDGWASEVFAEQVVAQLGRLRTALIESSGPLPATSELADPSFRCGPLVPPKLRVVFRDDAVTVMRPPPSGETPARPSVLHRGTAGFATAAEQLRAFFGAHRSLDIKFKVFHVESADTGHTSRQHVTMVARDGESTWEQHAQWLIRWTTPDDLPRPRIAQIEVEQFELITTQGHGGRLFADGTRHVLGSDASYADQFLRSYNEWLRQSQDQRFLYLLGNPGLAVADVNGDGLDDLYVCQEWGLPNRLFVHQTDGTARDIAAQAGVDWLDNSRTALLVDLDNDADQDLVVGVDGGVVLASGDGQGRFTVEAVLETGDDVLALSAADYDLDGRLDLYAGVYHPDPMADQASRAAIPVAGGGTIYHDANNGGANSLFRNQTQGQDWQFVEVTEELGLNKNNRRFTLAAAWEDYDNDGDQDLYVANDFGRNNLYRNDLLPDGRRQFTDVAAATQTEDSASGMSVTWGDYDRDGWMDLYVSNMFSAAGSRVTYQDRFKPQASADVRARLRRFARGNTLLRNPGVAAPSPSRPQESDAFGDTSLEAGVTMGRWAWGSRFVDINNDGWEDLVVANGYITTAETGDL